MVTNKRRKCPHHTNQCIQLSMGYLEKSFKLHSNIFGVFFSTPSFRHIMSMLDNKRHSAMWIKYKKLIWNSSSTNSSDSSKNSSIPEQITPKDLQTKHEQLQSKQISLTLIMIKKNITWPSSRDSSRKAMMIKIAAKPPETKDTNFATIDRIGDGNCFK